MWIPPPVAVAAPGTVTDAVAVVELPASVTVTVNGFAVVGIVPAHSPGANTVNPVDGVIAYDNAPDVAGVDAVASITKMSWYIANVAVGAPTAAVTVVDTVAVAVAPTLSVIVTVNPYVFVDGAVNVGFAAVVLDSVTVGPAVCVHAYVGAAESNVVTVDCNVTAMPDTFEPAVTVGGVEEYGPIGAVSENARSSK